MQMKARRRYEKPVLTRSRILLQSVVAQSGSPVATTPDDSTDDVTDDDAP
ncbi:hypothetical protein ABMA32_15970 [Mesorhizobium sp. VNQ89]